MTATLDKPIAFSYHPIRQAHLVALSEVYPIVFGTQHIKSFDITPKGSAGAYLYRVQWRGGTGLSNLIVSEKYRSADYAYYRSLTLTHIDDRGALSDQLHNNVAQLVTQGFFNQLTGRFIGPLIVIAYPVLLHLVQTGRIPYKLRNRPRSVCTYVEILIEDLAPFALFTKEYPQ